MLRHTAIAGGFIKLLTLLYLLLMHYFLKQKRCHLMF